MNGRLILPDLDKLARCACAHEVRVAARLIVDALESDTDDGELEELVRSSETTLSRPIASALQALVSEYALTVA